ncbi:Alginate export [Candidatus Magnetomoraceae bacterium gMMP-1]
MKKILILMFVSMVLLVFSNSIHATEVKDITKEVLTGPGSVSISTDKDIMMSFGATVRFIPTLENDWDFGLSEIVPGYIYRPKEDNTGWEYGITNKSFLKNHDNESGNVNDGYIRNETKIYFNAMPKNRKWSFYGALEFDRPIDTSSVDNRGGKSDDSSNFGLERLNASVELVPGLRLHAGWDVWGLDLMEAASMVYADDNPGFWLKGNYKPFDFSIAWHKLEENDFQIDIADHSGGNDEDRDLFAGYFDYHINDVNKLRLFYAYDRIRNVKAGDSLGVIIGGEPGTPGILSDEYAETDSHYAGAYYVGKLGVMEFMAEGVYKFGKANDTGLKGENNGVHDIEYNDFDIEAHAFAFDLAFEFKKFLGFGLKPHFGMLYTSGDDDSTDDTLGGYEGVANAQRFSQAWGGENTIIGDSNLVLGTALYGYLPEFYGNGTPVFTGGLQNFAGKGGGRGDAPGLTMYSIGITATPKNYLIYRTNVNIFRWNEDFLVNNLVDPFNNLTPTKVKAGYAGTEWDNELTVALSKNMFIKVQASFFFPGERVKDVTEAISGGSECDETASRVALELIWNF